MTTRAEAADWLCQYVATERGAAPELTVLARELYAGIFDDETQAGIAADANGEDRGFFDNDDGL